MELLKECYQINVRERGRELVAYPHELENVAKWLHCSVLKPWVLICGSVGNGKTTTTNAISSLYKALKANAGEMLKNRYLIPKQEQTQVDKLASLQVPTIYSSLIICECAVSSSEEYAKIKNIPVLVIDDLGIEPTRVVHFGTEISPIAELLYYRYEHSLMTIITTNKDFEELSEVYGDRLADRFKEVASTVGYNEKSYR